MPNREVPAPNAEFYLARSRINKPFESQASTPLVAPVRFSPFG
jgi:hypothetical protein